MTATQLAGVALGLAALPALLFWRNLRAYRPPPSAGPGRAGVSVLIPARNEESGIQDAVASVLANQDLDVEVIVLDDHSEDRTAALVAELSARDSRVRVESAPPLPPGWNGKQHACWVLGGLARHDRLVFMDADVRLEPAALGRMLEFQRRSGAELVSGFPRQETVTLLERLLIPMMHFVLLGYLPIERMRKDRRPGLGAGCGQLFLADRTAYLAMGGHSAIRASRHDGLTLPQAFRRQDYGTDLFDATSLARCRMYRNAQEVWSGLSKNAVEGMAHPARIVPFSLLLLGGHVLPLGLVGAALLGALPARASLLAVAALGLSLYPRLAAVSRFRQPLSGALLHPLGVLLLVAIQWSALARTLTGASTPWKGRP